MLWAFAVAEPLFNVWSGEFFTLATRLDAILWALAVAFFVPTALFLIEVLVGRVRPAAMFPLHTFFVCLLGMILTSRMLVAAASPSDAVQVAVAVVGGLGLAALYRRCTPVREFFTILAPAPIVFLLMFAWSSQAEAVLTGEEGIKTQSPPAGAPIVLITFDELPGTSLMKASGKLDAESYPNFAALAKGSTWFRNATTQSSLTNQAIPAMVTGRASTGESPTAPSHPESLFTALGGTYALHVGEGYTRLCPEKLCKRIKVEGHRARITRLVTGSLRVSLRQWAPGALYRKIYPPGGTPPDPGDQLRGFLPGLVPGDPTFHFAHVLLPHQPWRFLPSGKAVPYEQSSLEQLGGPVSLTNKWKSLSQVRTKYRAHLLQLGYADKLLGEALDRMRETGLYDRALMVVVADHGVSFQAGQSARAPSQKNAADLMSVPLFVKRPGQREGRVSNRFVSTTDIPATIADAANTKLPFGRGQSALSSNFRPPTDLEISAGEAGSARLSTSAFVRDRAAGLRRRTEVLQQRRR